MAKVTLEGIRVVEYANMVSGPYCSKLLADLGADVIKVEPPDGDSARAFGPFPNDKPQPEKSALFLYNNTSKRGITLKLGILESLDAFRRIIRCGDVLVDRCHLQYLEN